MIIVYLLGASSSMYALHAKPKSSTNFMKFILFLVVFPVFSQLKKDFTFDTNIKRYFFEILYDAFYIKFKGP